jgi:hypothetical protein
MFLRFFSVAFALSLAVAPARASTGINWFGAADVNSAPGYDAGGRFRAMADVSGDGRADFCRFTGDFLTCGVSNGKTFTDTVRSQSGLPLGVDGTFRGMADVNGDGRADFCRIIDDSQGRRLSCATSSGSSFGSFDVESDAGYDIGLGSLRTLADVDGDGLADYCRVMGNRQNRRVSCGRSNGSRFGSNDVQSATGIDAPAGSNRVYFRTMADVNGDKKADYCAIYEEHRHDVLRCQLSTGTDFNGGLLRSTPTQRFDLGNGGFRALVDVNGDGRADFCRTIAPSNRVVCSLSTPAGFGNDDVVTGTLPYDVGAELFREMADVNGDGRADFVRFTGAGPNRILSAGFGAKALVVDTIPFTMSGETHQDSEPFLAVNPKDVTRMAASAFLVNTSRRATTAPILVTTDSGQSWRIVNTVPSNSEIGDITLAFTSDTAAGPLYGGILARPDPPEYYRNLKGNAFDADLTTQKMRRNSDQPFLHANRNGPNRLYVGVNDFKVGPRTATVDVTTNGGASFTSARIDPRSSTAIQDGPPIRPAYSPNDNTVYAAYFTWREEAPRAQRPGYYGDVVVVRDDAGATGNNPFTSLIGPDGKAGSFVAKNILIPFAGGALGPERVGAGGLSIVVDPRHSATGTLYVAWCDRSLPDKYTLHVRRSTDKGVTWSADLRVVHNASVPSLAMSPVGSVVGLLYQQLVNNRWITHFEQTKDGFETSDDTILATAPGNVPARVSQPYLGDYHYVVGVGNEFRGAFSSNNTPAVADFPSSALFQRGVNTTTETLTKPNGTTVQVSIDPFYFSIRKID